MPGQEHVFFSYDNALCDNEEESQNYPSEFLNSITPRGMPPHHSERNASSSLRQECPLITPRGMPPHKLILKVGATVML